MAALDSTPGLSSSFAAEQFWAGVTVIGVVVFLVWLAGGSRLSARRLRHATSPDGLGKPSGGLITGLDNRYSTGKLIAVSWTILVAWMVVTEGYLAARSLIVTFSDLLKDASDLYFVLLGGPYAAAAFAKVSIQSKLAQGLVTKTTALSPDPFDVLSDDNGNVDLYDFQYVLFNVLAVLIVAFTFGSRPGQGLPDIPQFLAVLTGGAALTYSVNKAIASAGPPSPAVTNVPPVGGT